MDEGYIKIPRSLLEDPIWKSLPFTYRHIYLTILQHMAFETCKQNDFGLLTELKPGQFLTTERKLVDLCDEEEIDKSLIHRALIKFKSLGFSNHKTNRKKTIITITRTDILELLKPRIEPNSNQTRTIKEQCKEQSLYKGNVSLEHENIGSGSLPQQKKKTYRLNELQQEVYEWLLGLELNTDEQTLRYWAKNWPKEKLESAYCYMLKEDKKKPIGNPGGFIRSILNGTIIMVDEESIKNQAIAEKFSQEYPGLNLRFTGKYVATDKAPDTEVYFHLNNADFSRQLFALLDKSNLYV